MDALIPWFYLKGISAADMSEALAPLIGPNKVSAAVVLKLKEEWEREREARKQRDLSADEYVYLWADGVYFTIRLDSDDRQCILALIGATSEAQARRYRASLFADPLRGVVPACRVEAAVPPLPHSADARTVTSSRCLLA